MSTGRTGTSAIGVVSELRDECSFDEIETENVVLLEDDNEDVSDIMDEIIKAEKEQMEHQLKLVQIHMKRLLDARSRGEVDLDAVPFEPQIYTAKQLRLIRKVLDKWRAHRSFSMAEVVLSNAVAIKEANIIRYFQPSSRFSSS